jgi:hypothetical protein
MPFWFLHDDFNNQKIYPLTVAVHDLLNLTSDPRVKQRLIAADSDSDGRISRKDILKMLHSEMGAKKKLRRGLIVGGALLLFCLLMLAANAALTFAVVSLSKETSVQSSGVMTTKDGSAVVGGCISGRAIVVSDPSSWCASTGAPACWPTERVCSSVRAPRRLDHLAALAAHRRHCRNRRPGGPAVRLPHPL